MDFLNYQTLSTSGDISAYAGQQFTINVDNIKVSYLSQSNVTNPDGSRTYTLRSDQDYTRSLAVVFVDENGKALGNTLVDPNNISPATSPDSGNWTSGEYYNGLVIEPVLPQLPTQWTQFPNPDTGNFASQYEVAVNKSYTVDIPVGTHSLQLVQIIDLGFADSTYQNWTINDPAPYTLIRSGNVYVSNYQNVANIGMGQYDKILFRQNLTSGITPQGIYPIASIYSTETYTSNGFAILPGEQFVYKSENRYSIGYTTNVSDPEVYIRSIDILGITYISSETSGKNFNFGDPGLYPSETYWTGTRLYGGVLVSTAPSSNGTVPMAVIVTENTFKGDYAKPGFVVTLDASGSTDSDGDVLTYTWEVVSTTGPSVTLSSTDTAVTTFTVPEQVGGDPENIMVFRVTVSDGMNAATREVTVTSIPPYDPNKDYCPNGCGI